MKRLHSIFKITLGLLFTSMIVSCEKEYVPVAEWQDVSHETEMQPFYDANCVGCHNGGGIPLNLEASVSYDNLISGDYIDLTNPESSSLYTKIAPGGSMESYSTTSRNLMTLVWIQEGAKNN